MLAYILRELKRVSKRRLAKVYIVILVLLCLIANSAVMAFTLIYGADRDGVLGSNVLAFASWCFPLPYLACIFIADLVFGTEYPNPYIKDNVTKNIGRSGLYMGKFIAAAITGLVYMVIAFVCLLITTRLFHSDISSYDVELFVQNMVISIPLWFAGISFGMMYLFMFEKKKKAYTAFFITTLIVPRIIMFFAAEPFSVKPLLFIREALISQSFSHIPYIADPNRNVPYIIGQGIVYMIIGCIIGIFVYRKKKNY